MGIGFRRAEHRLPPHLGRGASLPDSASRLFATLGLIETFTRRKRGGPAFERNRPRAAGRLCVPPVRDPLRPAGVRVASYPPVSPSAKSAFQARLVTTWELNPRHPSSPLGALSAELVVLPSHPLQNPCAEYTPSDRSREARAPPEPDGPDSKNSFRSPGKRKSLPRSHTPEGFGQARLKSFPRVRLLARNEARAPWRFPCPPSRAGRSGVTRNSGGKLGLSSDDSSKGVGA